MEVTYLIACACRYHNTETDISLSLFADLANICPAAGIEAHAALVHHAIEVVNKENVLELFLLVCDLHDLTSSLSSVNFIVIGRPNHKLCLMMIICFTQS